MNLEETLEKAATARPGYELAAFKDAGLPVYLLTVRVLTLDHKPLSPIDEGVLKAVAAGLDTPDDIAAFLGLPSNVLTPVFAGLNTLELINYVRAIGDGKPRVLLTAKGRNALAIASTITPQEKTVRISLDAITRRLLFISPNALYKPRDMRELGLLEIPSGASKRPEVEDIPVEDFDRVLARQRAGRENASDLLSVRRVERRELHYLPCVMLFYRNQTRTNEVDVAFWREDGPSLDHEARFRELGGQDLVGAKFLVNKSAAPASDVVEQVSDYTKPAPAPVATPPIQPASVSPPANPVKDNDAESSGETLQQILCHEHPGLLTKALLHSKKRLLIISPWIRHQVVNWEFVASLEVLLQNGVDVYIGYGLDDGDGAGARNNDAAKKLPITPAAEKDLNRLATKYANFRFVYVGNTHRKSLVSDDSFAVVTSFNWLSFKGNPSDKPRDESGVVIRKKSYVEKEFEKGLTLLEQGYSGKPSNKQPIKRT
ncbi:hypothetical protein ACW73L_11245 [Methylolobus aquaticus]